MHNNSCIVLFYIYQIEMSNKAMIIQYVDRFMAMTTSFWKMELLSGKKCKKSINEPMRHTF